LAEDLPQLQLVAPAADVLETVVVTAVRRMLLEQLTLPVAAEPVDTRVMVEDLLSTLTVLLAQAAAAVVVALVVLLMQHQVAAAWEFMAKVQTVQVAHILAVMPVLVAAVVQVEQQVALEPQVAQIITVATLVAVVAVLNSTAKQGMAQVVQ
jgi:hypothetical protein